MTPAAWTALIVAFVVAVVVPGPDSLLLLRLGLRDRRHALLAAAGSARMRAARPRSEATVQIVLPRVMPAALPALQVIGSLVLVWLGLQSIRAGIRAVRDPAEASVAARITARPFRLGLVTNLSNPKAMLFFAALFSQILPPDAGWFDRVAVLAVLTILCAAWFTSYVLLTSSRGFQRWFRRATPAIDIVAGAVFILVAGAILVELALTALG